MRPFARPWSRQWIPVAMGLAAIVIVSWIYLAQMSREMGVMARVMPGAAGAMSPAWTVTMWIVMMTAMMLPTAVPMVAIHARFHRGLHPATMLAPYTALFAGGYVLAWSAWGALAAAAQIGLERTALLQPMAVKLTHPLMGAAVLVAAGLFQLTPFKRACLRHCRSPMGFFMTAWRDGHRGALEMGARHGLFCVGCCGALMAVLFVVGAMNLLWISALTAFVLLEKLGPNPRVVAWVSGLGLIGGAVAVLAG